MFYFYLPICVFLGGDVRFSQDHRFSQIARVWLLFTSSRVHPGQTLEGSGRITVTTTLGLRVSARLPPGLQNGSLVGGRD